MRPASLTGRDSETVLDALRLFVGKSEEIERRSVGAGVKVAFHRREFGGSCFRDHFWPAGLREIELRRSEPIRPTVSAMVKLRRAKSSWRFFSR